MEKFNVAICQIDVTRDKTQNLIHAEEMIREASKKARIVVLPEMFNCPYNANTFVDYSEVFPGETTIFLSKLAKELNSIIVGGSIPELDEGKLYNTSYTFNGKGNLIGKHRKVHLFDVDIKGGVKFKESSVLNPGDKITVIDVGFTKIGVAICYDMRFPELVRSMVDLGAEIIIVPAAFNTVTGPAHWHITSRVRAVDNQVYFVVASPARSEFLSYKAYGHSLIVSPWGDILSEAGENEEIVYAEIDIEYLYKVRSELPLLKHRKFNLYKTI